MRPDEYGGRDGEGNQAAQAACPAIQRPLPVRQAGSWRDKARTIEGAFAQTDRRRRARPRARAGGNEADLRAFAIRPCRGGWKRRARAAVPALYRAAVAATRDGCN